MPRPNVVWKKYSDDVKWANEQLKLSDVCQTGYSYDYFVLNDIGCGKLTQDRFDIMKKNAKNGSYHPTIDGIDKKYEDPDSKSIVLYMLIAFKYHNAIQDYGIKDFRVSLRSNNRYSYCICATTEEEDIIRLSGDWAISWDIIKNCSSDKQQCFELTKQTHTIIGHPIWPCETVENRNTVNQARKNSISMYETLRVLEKCYENKFEMNEKSTNLEKAFCDYKKWYLKFKSFNNYIQFWDLKRFTKEEITPDNISWIFSKL